MWDTNKDHDARRYERPADFFRALKKANASGRGFRIAYTGEGTPDLFEDWCAAVWSILDGHKLTYMVAEEFGAVCHNAGPLLMSQSPNHKRLWQESRKYGGIWHCTSQRPQSITKDAIENAGEIYAGSMGTLAAKRVGAEIEVDPKELRATQPGDFWYWNISMLRAEKQHIFTPQN